MSEAGADPRGDGGTPVPTLRPLDAFNGPLSRRVYLSLRDAIVTLRFQPGESLRKPEICDTLGVSRSPVSEAVARLASEGLVHVVPQAGTYVARFSMDEIREGAFLREALELAAVEYLAPRLTHDQLIVLRRNLRVQAALVEDGDTDGFYDLDGQFHAALMRYTGFPHLPQLAETLWVQVNRARQVILPEPGRVAATLDEHRAILAALEAQDVAAARAATRHHLRQLLTYLEPLERTRPDLFEPARFA